MSSTLHIFGLKYTARLAKFFVFQKKIFDGCPSSFLPVCMDVYSEKCGEMVNTTFCPCIALFFSFQGRQWDRLWSPITPVSGTKDGDEVCQIFYKKTGMKDVPNEHLPYPNGVNVIIT